MRTLRLVLTLFCVSWGFSGTASAENLKASDCRPLTRANAQACCAALNLRNVLSPQDQELCRVRPSNPLAGVTTNVAGAPGPSSPPDDTNTAGRNNGFGNGDQTPPGNSEPNNNAENATPGRNSPGNSGNNGNN
jgi:hypothetical protein